MKKVEIVIRDRVARSIRIIKGYVYDGKIIKVNVFSKGDKSSRDWHIKICVNATWEFEGKTCERAVWHDITHVVAIPRSMRREDIARIKEALRDMELTAFSYKGVDGRTKWDCDYKNIIAMLEERGLLSPEYANAVARECSKGSASSASIEEDLYSEMSEHERIVAMVKRYEEAMSGN